MCVCVCERPRARNREREGGGEERLCTGGRESEREGRKQGMLVNDKKLK